MHGRLVTLRLLGLGDAGTPPGRLRVMFHLLDLHARYNSVNQSAGPVHTVNTGTLGWLISTKWH
jgi:hypothetical protein